MKGLSMANVIVAETSEVEGSPTMNSEEFIAHVKRVELLCGLVESMMKAMVDTPFGAMLPPDLVKQARGL